MLFSCSVVSDSLWQHGLQHTRLPCPSLSHGVCSNSCPLSQWCHPTMSCSVIPFSSCLQCFPAERSFPMSQLFTLGGQRIRASASVLPMNIQSWFSLGLTGLISLLSKGLSRVFSNTTVQKHQFFGAQPSLWSSSHINTVIISFNSKSNSLKWWLLKFNYWGNWRVGRVKKLLRQASLVDCRTEMHSQGWLHHESESCT